ncbi:MAG: hypothetical protein GY765_01305, partial [bacterium]|nr:hypothetical protein [bacterium]
WGCYLINDYFRSNPSDSDYGCYCFGTLEEFMKEPETRYKEIFHNYSLLRQNLFFSGDKSCSECAEVNHCSMCPAITAYSTKTIGEIPPWMCRIHHIFKKIQLLPL